jgi:hypothetical protein
MRQRFAETNWAPWAGLVVGVAAWGAHHQIGSDMAYMRCTLSDTWISAVLGLVLLVVTVAATSLSWVSRRTGQAAEHAVEMRRFVAWLSTAGGALFALAIVFQTAAAVMVRTCAP